MWACCWKKPGAPTLQLSLIPCSHFSLCPKDYNRGQEVREPVYTVPAGQLPAQGWVEKGGEWIWWGNRNIQHKNKPSFSGQRRWVFAEKPGSEPTGHNGYQAGDRSPGASQFTDHLSPFDTRNPFPKSRAKSLDVNKVSRSVGNKWLLCTCGNLP